MEQEAGSQQPQIIVTTSIKIGDTELASVSQPLAPVTPHSASMAAEFISDTQVLESGTEFAYQIRTACIRVPTNDPAPDTDTAWSPHRDRNAQ